MISTPCGRKRCCRPWRGSATSRSGPTLPGLAFFEGNLAVVDDLCDQIAADDPARWKLKAMIADLERSAAQTEDVAVRAGLEAALNRLKALP